GASVADWLGKPTSRSASGGATARSPSSALSPSPSSWRCPPDVRPKHDPMTMTRDPKLAVSAVVGTAATVLFASLALAIVLRDGAPFAVDASLHQYALEARRNGLTAAARVVTTTGTGLPAYALAAAAGYAAGRGQPWFSAAGYLLALLL